VKAQVGVAGAVVLEGLAAPMALPAVSLDNYAAVAPEEVDGEWADRHVDLGRR
jgi:hypothetical protein